MQVNAELINSLAQKIDQVDLTGDERMVLDTVLARAAMSDADEVSGFSLANPLDGLNPLGRTWGAALGMLGSPGTGTIISYGGGGGGGGGDGGLYGRLPGT